MCVCVYDEVQWKCNLSNFFLGVGGWVGERWHVLFYILSRLTFEIPVGAMAPLHVSGIASIPRKKIVP